MVVAPSVPPLQCYLVLRTCIPCHFPTPTPPHIMAPGTVRILRPVPCADLVTLLLASDDIPAGAPRILALNPLLSYSSMPPIYFNVLHDVRSIRLRNGCSPSSLQQPALNQPVMCICIRFADHPYWSIEVSNPRGVTVLDVLLKIREALQRGVSPQEATVSHTVSEYFRARTRADPREYAQGVKRVDFLGPKVFFAGLSPSMDGQNRWDAHFVPTA
ncbi:hypothetical protein EDD15DRAFT_2284296 [Pisolithus albus]|nr:hypothetical protein EDD15DRAFT_2284296 [Pisolithus albus]